MEAKGDPSAAHSSHPNVGMEAVQMRCPSALHQGQGSSGSLVTFLLLVFLENSWQSFQSVHGAQPPWVWSLLVLDISLWMLRDYACL